MPFATIHGYNIHYHDCGDPAAAPVVLIHGLMNSMHVWNTLTQQLATHYRVIRLDLLGHGESEKPANPDLSIPVQGRIVTGVLTHLGIERAAVVGHSMGGQTALWIGANQPERVTRLAVLTPFADRFFTPITTWNTTLVMIGATIRPLGRLMVPLGRRPGLVRRLLVEGTLYYRPQPDSIFREVFDEQFRDDNNACKIGAIRGLYGYRALDDVHKITAPLLIVGVEHDRVVPNAHAQRLAARRPDAQFTVIPNCGHMLQYDAPNELYSTLSAFLVGQPVALYSLNGHHEARYARHGEHVWTSGGGSHS
jgi:pimeloyl-ACP methyl ester carboxylesterase